MLQPKSFYGTDSIAILPHKTGITRSCARQTAWRLIPPTSKPQPLHSYHQLHPIRRLPFQNQSPYVQHLCNRPRLAPRFPRRHRSATGLVAAWSAPTAGAVSVTAAARSCSTATTAVRAPSAGLGVTSLPRDADEALCS